MKTAYRIELEDGYKAGLVSKVEMVKLYSQMYMEGLITFEERQAKIKAL